MRPTIFITGATDGLGRAVAGELAARGAWLIVHGRDPAKVDDVVAELGGAPHARGVVADLAGLAEVDRLADEIEATTDELHVLVNNAGIGYVDDDRRESADGHELIFAVNHLAALRLTHRLIPLLKRSAPARIVQVASLGQAPLDLDDPQLTRRYTGSRAYGQSKLAMIGAAMELAGELEGTDVTVNSLHPGTYMPTKMVLQGGGTPIDTLQTGIDSTVRLITDPALQGTTGVFFDRRQPQAPHEQAADPAQRRRVYELSLELIRASTGG